MARSGLLVLARGCALAAVLGAVVACSTGTPSGGSAGSSSGASASPSPAASILSVSEQVAATRSGITEAIAAYQASRNNQALELVTSAYLDHFEFVERPLGAIDATLNETLEHKIREDLRTAITNGRPVDEVSALGSEILKLLDQAAQKLG